MRWVARKTTSISTTAWTSPRPLSSASSNTVMAFSRSGTFEPANSRPMAPPGTPGAQRGRHVGGAPVGAGFEVLADSAEIGLVAGLVPGGRDRFGNERRLDVVDPAPAPGHAPDDAGQHREAFLAVVAVMVRRLRVDHGEGVETGRVLAEGNEGAAERLRSVLERPPVVDDHRLAAGADQPRDELLHEHRLARAGLAGDGDVVIAGVVGEGRPAGRLAPAADQEQGGRVVGVGRAGRATRRAAAPG